MTDPKQRHVLVVDDHAATVEITRRVLEYSGFAVTAFTSSIEALRVLREHPGQFDLMIADQDMPDLSGVDLARLAWQVRHSLPVLFISAMVERITFDAGTTVGRYLQLSKPYDTDALVASTRALTEKERGMP